MYLSPGNLQSRKVGMISVNFVGVHFIYNFVIVFLFSSIKKKKKKKKERNCLFVLIVGPTKCLGIQKGDHICY